MIYRYSIIDGDDIGCRYIPDIDGDMYSFFWYGHSNRKGMERNSNDSACRKSWNSLRYWCKPTIGICKEILAAKWAVVKNMVSP